MFSILSDIVKEVLVWKCPRKPYLPRDKWAFYWLFSKRGLDLAEGLKSYEYVFVPFESNCRISLFHRLNVVMEQFFNFEQKGIKMAHVAWIKASSKDSYWPRGSAPPFKCSTSR